MLDILWKKNLSKKEEQLGDSLGKDTFELFSFSFSPAAYVFLKHQL